MPTPRCTTQAFSVPTFEPKTAPPPCPVCSGPLIVLGRTWRCSRCHFAICDECEGISTDEAK